jgi:hyperosmotically inducible protein
MFKALLTLAGGIVIGFAIAHFVFGPIDWSGVRDKTGDVVSDTATVTAVRAALALQKDFALFGDMQISADDGVVTLRGRVANEQQRELAALISRGVEGVREVINELETSPEDPGDDGSEVGR